MNYQRVSYFIKAAEVLNFSEAARQLFITPQSFGKQIALLEEELGEKQFDRTTREVKLTPFGKACYNNFSGLIRALERNFAQMCELGHGRLNRKRRRLSVYFGKNTKNRKCPFYSEQESF